MRRDMWRHLRSAFRPERLPIASGGRQRAKPSPKPACENSCLLYAYGYSIGFSLSLVGKANAWQGALQLCVMPAGGWLQLCAAYTIIPSRSRAATSTFSPSFSPNTTVRLDRTGIFARVNAAGIAAYSAPVQVLARVLRCDVQRPPKFSRCAKFDHLGVTK